MGALAFPATSIIDSTAAGRSVLTAADAAAQRVLLSALTTADICSGTLTARADDVNLSGGSDGDVLTVQADGSLALEAAAGGGIGGSTGSTDNALLRADGTGGATVQGGGLTLEDAGSIVLPAVASHATIQTGIRLGAAGGVWLRNFGDNGVALGNSGVGNVGYWNYSHGFTLRTGWQMGWNTDPTSGPNSTTYFSSAANGTINCTGVLTVDGVMSCGVYTFATVPSASANTGKFLRISDRAQKHAYSDGTDWRFFGDDAIIS